MKNAKMGTIKDRNGMDPTEAEDIKKRWQESTEELYKKDLHDPDNHDGVITDLEPDIQEWEVKWALGSIIRDKASGEDGLSAELFQILKDDAMKALNSKCHQIWKTQQWPQDWKRSVFIPIPKKGNAKECSNYRTITLISHASMEKAMAPHSSTLAWKIPWTEETGRLQSMGSLRVGQDSVTSLSLFTFMHWRRKWQPTPVFLPGESQGRQSLVGCRLWGGTESDTTEAT